MGYLDSDLRIGVDALCSALSGESYDKIRTG